MAKQSIDSNLQFTDEEISSLRVIVNDWVNEGIVIPPYDDATTSVIAKLGADQNRVAGRVAAAAPATRAVAAELDEQTEPVVIRPAANLG